MMLDAMPLSMPFATTIFTLLTPATYATLMPPLMFRRHD